MTKKKYLGLSAFLNLSILVFFSFITYRFYASAGNISSIIGIPEVVAGIPLENKLIPLLCACGFMFAAFVMKLVARWFERNTLTKICMILDLIIAVTFAYFAKATLGEIFTLDLTNNLAEGGIFAISILTLLLDVFSLPAESWGRL